MKTATLNRKQIAQQNRRTLKIGSRVQINFSGTYWANGICGQVVEMLNEGRLLAVRIADHTAPTGYTTIDCPLAQVLPAAW
jgi:hypothetical protein